MAADRPQFVLPAEAPDWYPQTMNHRIDGDLVRRERMKRAWTQEELSERSNLGVRTLRRIEAGQGSLDSLRRVAEAMEMEPSKVLVPEGNASPLRIPFDPLRVQLSMRLVTPANFKALFDELIERIKAIRRNYAWELGIILPGVRFQDFKCPDPIYQIYVRNVLMGQGELQAGKLLAVSKQRHHLADLDGLPTTDPSSGLPAVWIDEGQRSKAEELDCVVFDHISVVGAHLTRLVAVHAHRIIGTEEVAKLIDDLKLPNLVDEVVPHKTSLTTLRGVIRNLLAEQVSVIDLALILETLADHATLDKSADDLTPVVRRALRHTLCQPYLNKDGKIAAYTLRPEWEQKAEADPGVLDELTICLQGLEPLVLITSSKLRHLVKNRYPQLTVLADDELSEMYDVASLGELPVV